MVKGQVYFSYLLRLWQVGTGQGAGLASVAGGDPHRRAQGLRRPGRPVRYLREQTRAGSPPEEGRLRERGASPTPAMAQTLRAGKKDRQDEGGAWRASRARWAHGP